jgi:hypothetical protein
MRTAYVGIRRHTSAYVTIRLHTSAYVGTRRSRQHTSAYVCIRQHTSEYVSIRQHTSADVGIREQRGEYTSEALSDSTTDTPIPTAYVSIRRNTSAYVSIRQHTSAERRVYLGGPLGLDNRHADPDSIRQHTFAYVSRGVYIPRRPSRSRQPTRRSRVLPPSSPAQARAAERICRRTAYVSIRQHTSAYVSIRQHTSAYVGSGAYAAGRGSRGCMRDGLYADICPPPPPSAPLTPPPAAATPVSDASMLLLLLRRACCCCARAASGVCGSSWGGRGWRVASVMISVSVAPPPWQ